MSCEFCQVQGTFWLRNESPNHAHSKLHTEGSHCSSFSLSSSRTGVTRGRVSPCHLFPSSFAFPLGEMPNEGRRRMKIKLDKPHGVLSRAERRPMECFRGQNVDPVWRRCARRTTAPGSRYRLR
ncbi:hypothetical protein MRB53_009863 [Persea americana]|uniref:Uncharacterized protein n=1 Tax=Persea americana TaxID=3435 RepID=A0ACC2LQA3_PERAE|nr:hypothetical protein MRB53_009863 [Persea americana]